MSMLNIGEVLNTMVRDNSRAAKLENNLASAMFSTQVGTVVNDAIAAYETSAEHTTALVTAKKISREQALFIVESRKQQALDARAFSSRYFAG